MIRTRELEILPGIPPCFEFDVTLRWDQSQLNVRWGARETLLHEIPIAIPSYPYSMLRYCLAGGGVLMAGDERLEIGPEMFFWVAAGHPTELTALPDMGMSNFVVALGGSGASEEVERYLHSPIGATGLKNPQAILSILQTLMDEGLGTDQHREEICAMLAGVLLRRVQAQAISSSQANALARQTFQRCREHIERNFTTLSTLREVADACELTVPYLCRLFDLFFRCSAYEYLTQLKMSRAENLLLRPKSPVSEVARAVGYKNARLFARNFKATFGKNPTEYRTAHAGQRPGDD